MNILRHQRNLIAQGAQGVFTQVVAVQQDLPIIDIVETRNQAGDGRFTRTRAPYQRHGFPFRNIQVNIAQRGDFTSRVSEGDVFKFEVALRTFDNPRAFIFLLLGVKDSEKRLTSGHPALELRVDVSQRLQRAHQRDHRGENNGDSPGRQRLHHAREAGSIEHESQGQRGDQLNNRVRN